MDGRHTMEGKTERRCMRSRVVLVLIGCVGLLFSAAIVGEKQRVWEGRNALEEDFAKELGHGGSAAQKLAALHKMLEKTALDLQGSDRATSRSIKREESLYARPSAGMQEGAAAEWASGGASAASASVRAPNHAARMSTYHRDMHRLRELEPTASPSALARSAQSLEKDIQHEEQLAAAAGVPSKASSVQTQSLAGARPGVFAQERSQAPAQQQEAPAQQTAAPAQQLVQVWQGPPVEGAVYAPSVMTPYQQQMLNSYLGAPVVDPPPAIRSSADTTQQLQEGSAPQQVQAPRASLHGAAMASAWKAYLDPESVKEEQSSKHALKSKGRATQQAPSHGATSDLFKVGKAVEDLALDSDGVLQHAESIMSSVKKTLEHASTRKAAAPAAQSAVPAALRREQKALLAELAGAMTERKKLERERAEVLAKEYKMLAKSIPDSKQGTHAKMSTSARTQQLVSVQAPSTTALKPGQSSGSHPIASNKSASMVQNKTALAISQLKVLQHQAQDVANSSAAKRSVGAHGTVKSTQPTSTAAAASPVDTVVQSKVGAAQPVKVVKVTDSMPKALMEGAARALPKAAAYAGVSAAVPLPGAEADAAAHVGAIETSRGTEKSRARGDRSEGGGHAAGEEEGSSGTPLISVNIRDSRIVGGLHISRNTGERKGPGAQSGCGALCELGKLVQNVEGGKYQSLRGAREPKMVERDYIIAHVGGKPVYAHEMQPVSPSGADTHSEIRQVGVPGGEGEVEADDEDSGGDNGKLTFDSLEGGLEKAIERQGERRGEVRERLHEQVGNGEQWARYVRRQRRLRAARAGAFERESADASDGSSHPMDRQAPAAVAGATPGVMGEAGAGQPSTAVRYKVVHYKMPLAEYMALSERAPAQDAEVAAGASDGWQEYGSIYDGLY